MYITANDLNEIRNKAMGLKTLEQVDQAVLETHRKLSDCYGRFIEIFKRADALKGVSREHPDVLTLRRDEWANLVAKEYAKELLAQLALTRLEIESSQKKLDEQPKV